MKDRMGNLAEKLAAAKAENNELQSQLATLQAENAQLMAKQKSLEVEVAWGEHQKSIDEELPWVLAEEFWEEERADLAFTSPKNPKNIEVWMGMADEMTPPPVVSMEEKQKNLRLLLTGGLR